MEIIVFFINFGAQKWNSLYFTQNVQKDYKRKNITELLAYARIPCPFYFSTLFFFIFNSIILFKSLYFLLFCLIILY